MNPQIVSDAITELRSKLEALEATVKADAPAEVAPVIDPLAFAVEVPAAPVADVPADAAAPVVAQDIEQLHAKVDGIAAGLVEAVQALDSKVDAALDYADGWAIHPKTLFAGLGGVVATIAAYVVQLSNVHVDGGVTTGAGAAAIVAVLASWAKSA